MLKIAICDDEQNAIDNIDSILTKNQKNLKIELKIDTFIQGERLLKSIADGNNYDLIFLDIEMNEIDGITLGQQIRTTLDDYGTNIVIVSARPQYALRAYEIMPLGFVVKPAKEENIMSELNKVLKLYDNKEKYVTYNINRDKYRVLCKDIYYIESQRKEIKVHLKESCIQFYKTLTEIEEELKNYGFYRISKSCIVNERYVISLEGMKLTLKNGVEIIAGSKYTDRLFDLMEVGGMQ